MKKIVKIIITIIVIFMIGIVAISKLNNQILSDKKISIVTSNFPAYDFARAVSKDIDSIEIKMLVKPGAETHEFEPTPNDIISIQSSKLFIYTGGESDKWIEEILNNIDSKNTKLFKMMDVVNIFEEEIIEGMEREEGKEKNNTNSKQDISEKDEEIEYDEHIWTSPKNAIEIVGKIKEELIKISPENQKKIEENAEKYSKTLSDLDSKFKKIVNSSKRKTIVFGDRFPLRYFTEEYGLKYYAAFPGCTSQTEANSQTVAFLVNKVKSEKIPVILKVELSNNNIAKTISKETGAKILTFNAAHNISMDDFNNGLTYTEIMEQNLKTLNEALN